MALFSKKSVAPKTAKKETKASGAVAPARGAKRDLSSVLQKPRLSEKAVAGSERNVYAFVVRPDATKRHVAEAVKAEFKVTPVKVNIVNKAPRQHMSRRLGRTVTEKGMKKAYVFLKKGDTINLV